MVSLTQWPLPLRAAATVPHFGVRVKDPGRQFTKKPNADRTRGKPSEHLLRLAAIVRRGAAITTACRNADTARFVRYLTATSPKARYHGPSL
jgi:hypothetical protein